MATLRARLTVTYGFALVGGLIVFAAALYAVRAADEVEALGPVAVGAAAAASPAAIASIVLSDPTQACLASIASVSILSCMNDVPEQ